MCTWRRAEKGKESGSQEPGDSRGHDEDLTGAVYGTAEGSTGGAEDTAGSSATTERRARAGEADDQAQGAAGHMAEVDCLPKPTLQKLEPDDDIEDFLTILERIVKQQEWLGEVWPTNLAGFLTGKAMTAYASLQSKSVESYKSMKKAILHRYIVDEEDAIADSGRTARSWKSPTRIGGTGCSTTLSDWQRTKR